MKFFVDTAETKDIADLAATGLVDGVTTNPSLIAKSGRNFAEVIAEICKLTDGPVSAEVVATEHDGMVAEGKKLAAIAPNVCVKLPLILGRPARLPHADGSWHTDHCHALFLCQSGPCSRQKRAQPLSRLLLAASTIFTLTAWS